MLRLNGLFLHLQFCSLFICFFHFHFLLFFFFISYSSQLRSSLVNVVLTFRASLILLAPAPILFPVHLFFSFSFHFSFPHSYSSHLRSSTVNVVLTFNDSLILLAPSAPISLPVHLFSSFSFTSFYTTYILIHHLPDPVQSMYY